MNTTPTPKQLAAIRQIALAVIDTVKEMGDTGAPAGVLYAAMQAHGCSKNQFDSLMGALCRGGKLRYDADSFLYFAV
jgi:hypothetical protein